MIVRKGSVVSEDWLSLWIGLSIFLLSLGSYVGYNVLGWGIKINVWSNISNLLTTVSNNHTGLPGILSLVLTYLFMLIIIGVGLKFMGVGMLALLIWVNNTFF